MIEIAMYCMVSHNKNLAFDVGLGYGVNHTKFERFNYLKIEIICLELLILVLGSGLRSLVNLVKLDHDYPHQFTGLNLGYTVYSKAQ